MIIAVFAIAMALVFVFIQFELSKKSMIAFFTKGFASFGFISLAIYGIYSQIEQTSWLFFSTTYITIDGLIVLGLVCGLLGDLYLALRPLRPKKEDGIIIISGIICFSLGHLFYLFALFQLSSFSYLSVIVSLVVTAIVYVGMIKMNFKMGIAKWPVLIYSLLIFLMIGQSLSYALDAGFIAHSIVLFSGAILFGISDLILAPIYFKNKQDKIFIASNLITYYAAQLLIAFSLYLLAL